MENVSINKPDTMFVTIVSGCNFNCAFCPSVFLFHNSNLAISISIWFNDNIAGFP